MRRMEKLRHFSLFSGIESFKKALTNLGVDNESVGYSELDKYASVALSAIHGVSEELNYGDITKIDEKEVPDCDLITYGFPCQDISTAGHQKGIVEGETRSGLLYDALRIIKYKMPKYAIAENVKNLVGKKFKDDFNSLLEELDSYGYNNYWKVLNAKDYGIPQNRERVFVVSIRKDVDKGYEFPEGFDNGLRLKDLLEDEVEDKYYLPEGHPDYDNYDKSKVDKSICPINPIHIGSSVNFGNSVSNSGAAYTIRASQSNGILKEDYRIRKLTPLECFRLMGFTDEDYRKARQALEDRFYNGKDRSNSQMYKMAGNSIAVNVIEGILMNLLFEKEMLEILEKELTE